MEVDSKQNLTVNLTKPLFTDFEPKGNISQQACISRTSGKWSAELCQTQVEEKDDASGSQNLKCLCKTVSPVTVVADLKGLFGDSKVGEVFSADGLSAFANMEFYKMYIFYILLFKTLIFLYLLVLANRMDN